MYPKYKVLELQKCTRCDQKGYTIRTLSLWQRFMGMSEQMPCYCSLDFETGDFVVERWVDLDSDTLDKLNTCNANTVDCCDNG